MKRDFTFKGFEPDDKIQVLARERYDSLYNIVPCDSVPKIFIEKEGTQYSGRCEVISSQGTFEVAVHGAQASQVINELYEGLQLQLQNWKKVRFL